MTVNCAHGTFGGAVAAGGIGGLIHKVHETQQRAAASHDGPAKHYAGESLGLGDVPQFDFSHIPLTPMAHGLDTASTVSLSLIALVGIACAALILTSMLVRTVIVACSR
jgi:hypothetical protein